MPCDNGGADRTGELERQRVPVEHDERLCPGVSTRNHLFMIEQFNKHGPNFLPPPASLFQALRFGADKCWAMKRALRSSFNV